MTSRASNIATRSATAAKWDTRQREHYERVLRQVPEHYLAAPIGRLEPHAGLRLTQQRQLEVRELLRELIYEDPRQNVILYGPPGTGKTQLMACVFRFTAAKSTALLGTGVVTRKLYWADMGQWQKDISGSQFGRCHKPDLSAEMVLAAAKRGYRSDLFLDEFDKVSDAPHERPFVDALIRAAYDCDTTIMVTTNCRRDEFQRRFDDHIYRRLDENGVHIDLFKGLK